MKKITQTILLLLMTIAFTNLGAQNMLDIYGQISPVNSPISVSVTYEDAGSFFTATVMTDGVGNFIYSDTINSTQGFTSISFNDCNGTLVSDSMFYSPTAIGVSAADYGVITNCSNSNTNLTTMGSITSAPGNYSVNLSYDYGSTYTPVLLNASGSFSETTTVPAGINYVLMTFTDCNNVLQTDTAPIAPALIGYIASFAAADYCDSSSATICSANFTLNQNVVIDSFNNVISSGNVMVINNSTGQNLTYTWDFGDNSATYTGLNFTHTYASAGPWTLCLTVDDGNGCVNTFCDSLMVDTNGVLTGKTNAGFTIQMGTGEDDTNGPNSINDLEENVTATVFPNPALNEVSLNLNSKISENALITIYNAMGSIVYNQSTEIKTGDQTININIEALNTGLFIMQLKTNKGTINKKIIKK